MRATSERLIRNIVARVIRLSVRAMRIGWTHSAFVALQQTVNVFPRILVARIWLARVAIFVGADEVAAKAIQPESVDHLSNVQLHYCRIASLYIQLEYLDSAFRYLNLAKEFRPDSAAVYYHFALYYRAREQIDNAVTAFRRSADLGLTKKLKLDALGAAATCMADAARADAIIHYQEILKVDPFHAMAYYGIIECRRDLHMEDPVVEKLHELLSSVSVPPDQKSHLHYALGLMYDRAGETGSAFAHWTLANQIRDRVGSAHALSKADADARCKVFDSELINRLSAHGCQEDVLICVVGMPRSGTTLVEQILGSHPDIQPLGERADFAHLARMLPRLIRTRIEYPECCSKLTATAIKYTWQRILRRLRRVGGSKRVVTKLPEDFFELGIIKILFPKVRVINCERNPLDVCLSCYVNNFQFIPYSRDLHRLADYYSLYRQMIRHWKHVMPEGSLFDVKYEGLVAEPEVIVRALCEFVAVPYEPSCLEFHRQDRIVSTLSRWQVR